MNTEFEVASQLGNELLAVEGVMKAVQPFHLDSRMLERLKTAVAETTMNAMEHGNHFQADIPVKISVKCTSDKLSVEITDQGGSPDDPECEAPDLDAKLAGLQSPRGWGLFLIRNMVDEMYVCTDDIYHTVELVMHLKGDDGNDNPAV